MGNEAMLSIKEFADFTGLNESTLRYYDQIGLLSPELRGENRYRYYSPLQTIMVEFIKVMIEVGVPLSTIKEMSANRTPEAVLALLMQQEHKLDVQLHDLQTAYTIIHTYRNTIQAGIGVRELGIAARDLDATSLTLGPINNFNGCANFYKPFMQFCTTAHEHKINLNYPIGGYYKDAQAFFDAPSQPTRFFSLDPRGYTKRKAGQYLVAHNKGYYGEFGELPQKLRDYAQTHTLAFNGPLYIIYLLDEISMADHTQFLSQLVVGVTPSR